MDSNQFRTAGKQLVDYIALYMDEIRDRPVLSDVEPGFINQLVPDEAPEEGETWPTIFNDVEPVIMKGMTHWHSPRFHAYFPTANSFPAICGDMLSTAVSCIGFTWNAAPSCTELEMKMMDWLAKMLGLPDHFCFDSGKGGGGVVQSTASESTLIALLGARSKVMAKFGFDNRISDDETVNDAKYLRLSRLVAYTSSQSHSSVEKAAMLSATRIRLLPVLDDLGLDPKALEEQIEKDRKNNLIPFLVIATSGTTNTCAFDDLEAIGKICERENLWMHVDSAYAGAAFVCPEFRHFMKGIEYVTSFSMNPHKWLLINFDCNAFWVKKRHFVENVFKVNPLYLKHDNEGKIPDYRHWQIPLGRRFRSIKMWFVFRSYGHSGLQEHIRAQVRLAEYFGQLLTNDDRFELFDSIKLGLVCFRLKGSNELNEELHESINKSRLIFLVPAKVKDVFFLRLAICARLTEKKDIEYSWDVVKHCAEQVLKQKNQLSNGTLKM